MKGREIDLLGVYQLVVGKSSDIFDMVDKEGIGLGVVGEKDDLGSSRGQLLYDGSTDA